MTRETHRKERVGVVVANKMQKTVIVAIESFKRHRIYKKLQRRTRRFKAHDESGRCALGDIVRIVETRPLSRGKHWRVAEILVRGDVAEVAPKEIDAEIIKEITPEAPPPPPVPKRPVEEVAVAEEPEVVAEEVPAAEEPQVALAEAPPPDEAKAEEGPPTDEPEAVVAETPSAEAEESEAAAEQVEAAEERPQGDAETEEPASADDESAPDTEEER